MSPGIPPSPKSSCGERRLRTSSTGHERGDRPMPLSRVADSLAPNCSQEGDGQLELALADAQGTQQYQNDCADSEGSVQEDRRSGDVLLGEVYLSRIGTAARPHRDAAILCPPHHQQTSQERYQDKIGEGDPGQKGIVGDQINDPNDQTAGSQQEMGEYPGRRKVRRSVVPGAQTAVADPSGQHE